MLLSKCLIQQRQGGRIAGQNVRQINNPKVHTHEIGNKYQCQTPLISMHVSIACAFHLVAVIGLPSLFD